MASIQYLLLSVLFISLHGTDAKTQINTTHCGKSFTCFRKPSGCSSLSTCDFVITYVYNTATKLLDVAIGGKRKWIAFGLNNAQSMADTSGHVCYDDGGVAFLKKFKNNDYTPDFSASVGLTGVKNEKDPQLLCRFSRPVTGPSGSVMKSLNTNWYLVAAFGDNIVGGKPTQHGSSSDATQTSVSKVDLKKVLIVAGKPSVVDKKVVAHGSMMIIAWLSFVATGVFFARYQKPTFGDSTCIGQKIWFQMHRSCMAIAITLSVIATVIIFVKAKGWSTVEGAHPYTGILTVILGIIQPIMAAFRPHPGTDRRWIFTWAHRTVGLLALMLAVVSIFLGLKLVKVSNTVLIVLVCIYVALVIVTEIALIFYDRKAKNTSVQYNTDSNTVEGPGGQSSIPPDESIGFRKIMLGIAIIAFFVLGLALVIVVIKSTADSPADHH